MGVFRSARGCFGSIVSSLLLVVAAYGGWKWGDHVFPRAEAWFSDRAADSAPGVEVSEAVATAASGRLERLTQVGGPGEVLFDGDELTSLLRFRAADRLPAAVMEPTIRVEDDRATLQARVALDQLPRFPDLSEFQALVSDTVSFRAEGTLIPSRGTGAAFLVQGLQLGRVPLPRRVIPSILNALGRTDAPGLPEDAIEIPLPGGTESAYLRDGQLVLTSSGE